MWLTACAVYELRPWQYLAVVHLIEQLLGFWSPEESLIIRQPSSKTDRADQLPSAVAIGALCEFINIFCPLSVEGLPFSCATAHITYHSTTAVAISANSFLYPRLVRHICGDSVWCTNRWACCTDYGYST